MDISHHTMNTLFQQLGLPSADRDIDQFVSEHKGLPPSVSIDSAKLWNSAQSEFLRESLAEDSDWSELIDQLDVRLRA